MNYSAEYLGNSVFGATLPVRAEQLIWLNGHKM